MKNDQSIPSDNTSTAAEETDGRESTDPRGEAAYKKILPVALALPATGLLQVNLDIGVLISQCIAVAARVAEHRKYLAALPDFDMESADGLDEAGLALSVAQANFRTATSPSDALTEIVARGSEVRNVLQNAADSLADVKLLDRTKVELLRGGGTSYRDLAAALRAAVQLFIQSDWERLKAKSVLTDELLTEAKLIAERIWTIAGNRDLNPARIAAATDIRARMFNVCLGRYDQVRRAATFMRWNQDDVDTIAPSLYPRGPRHAKDTKDAKDAAPAVPVAKPVILAAPAAPQEEGLRNNAPFTS